MQHAPPRAVGVRGNAFLATMIRARCTRGHSNMLSAAHSYSISFLAPGRLVLLLVVAGLQREKSPQGVE